MKVESGAYLAKARETLAGAKQIATLPLPHTAAREAYLAVFNAAEAYIFEQTDNVAKSHRGMRSEFARLVLQLRIALELDSLPVTNGETPDVGGVLDGQLAGVGARAVNTEKADRGSS